MPANRLANVPGLVIERGWPVLHRTTPATCGAASRC